MSRLAADVIEDAEWLDDNGVGGAEASKRLDFPTPHAMEKWLERHDRYDLWLRFKARDPKGMHDKKNRSETVTVIDPIAGIIARGKKSEAARIRRKAEKVEALVEELQAALAAHVEDQKAKAEARAEVARLERQLAGAKARLRGGAPTGPSAKEVREWAAENDVDCPAMGRIPGAVMDAYEDAQREAAS